MSFFDAFGIVLAAAVVIMYVVNHWRDVQYVISDVDGEEYLVRKTADALEAANTLARLNDKVGTLLVALAEKYPNDKRVERLVDRYNPRALSEGSHEAGYTSYSVNKGESIVMCLRSRDGKSAIEKENTLMYVLIHELAHLSTNDVGHTKRFWNNFRFLVQEAVEAGVYSDRDYSKDPATYCGMTIDSSSVTKSTIK